MKTQKQSGSGKRITGRKPAAKKAKRHPVPNWMSAESARIARGLTDLERIEVAHQMEKQAAELRGFAPKEVAFDGVTRIGVLPAVKKALLRFYEEHCGNVHEPALEALKLELGARWVIEVALTLLPQIAAKSAAFARYREQEGFSDSVLTENWVAASLAEWEKQLAAKRADNTDEGDEGDEWKSPKP